MAGRDPQVAQALVDVCRQRVPSLPRDPAVIADFVDAVRLHRLAPLAHVVLRDERPDIAEQLRRDRDVTKAVHLRASLVLDQLGGLLEDVPWAVFKGPVLSELAHPVAGLRTYGDVDVLVDPRDLREIAGRLQQAGWAAGDHFGHHYHAETPGEMHWRTPAGLLVDLHWSMLNAGVVRDRHAVRSRDLLARRRMVGLGLTTAPVLDEVDAFVHVCMHAGLSGAHRLLWLLDVDQLAQDLTGWNAVAVRARQWGAHASLAVVLGRAAAILGTPVPAGFDEALDVTPAARTLMAAADRMSAVPSLRHEESLAKLVGRAARPTGPRMAGQVVRKLALGAWHRRPFAPAPDDQSTFVVVDDAAREHFLSRVEHEVMEGAQP